MREDDFLIWLAARFGAAPNVAVPPGDDLAALRVDDDLLLLGSDNVLDGVHADLRTHAPELFGGKAARRNLSDCAAMACLPVALVLNLILPHGSPPDLPHRILEGADAVAKDHGCRVVGGDTSSWPGPLAVSVTVLARAAGVPPVTRRGARPGDRLYVTGPLGGSLARGRHLTFEPRVALARALAQRFELHAMLDLSDGLARDLPRLCEASGVGATLDAARIPVHADARVSGGDPLTRALGDGEDYELLFASPGCDHPHAIEVGTVDAEPGVRLRTPGGAAPLAVGGWEHGW